MVTIKQIAETAGVSSSTVSRILNDDTSLSVSSATRQAVLETAQRHVDEKSLSCGCDYGFFGSA